MIKFFFNRKIIYVIMPKITYDKPYNYSDVSFISDGCGCGFKL
jgi:hypothetical protein